MYVLVSFLLRIFQHVANSHLLRGVFMYIRVLVTFVSDIFHHAANSQRICTFVLDISCHIAVIVCIYSLVKYNTVPQNYVICQT